MQRKTYIGHGWVLVDEDGMMKLRRLSRACTYIHTNAPPKHQPEQETPQAVAALVIVVEKHQRGPQPEKNSRRKDLGKGGPEKSKRATTFWG